MKANESMIKKLTAADPETRSEDVVAANIDQLRVLFPEAFTEGKIDYDVLKQLLGGQVDEREEKYSLNWHGKRRARQLALTPSTGTLRPCPEDSVDWDTTKNLMIEGDNLEVLKLLQKSYSGKVKLIYIDPPYNSGTDFVYPDRFQDNVRNYLELTGQVGEGRSISSNTESNGRFHTDWLNMMLPRMMLSRNVLADDGVLLVSIDDGEVHHLRAMLDSVFGIENFVGSFVWEGGRKNDARLISLGHDYVLVYARNRATLRDKDVRWREKKAGLEPIYDKVSGLRQELGADYKAMHAALLKWYRELPDEHPSKAHDHFNYVDQRGIYFPDNLRSPNPRPNLVYDWKGFRPHPNGWAYAREKMAELDADDRLVYPDHAEQRVKIKSYLHEHEDWSPGSVFYKDRRAASKALTRLMDGEVFDFPKDVGVLARLIETITTEGDLILDFFAGSGTTGHAIMQLNKGGAASRRFILVQLPEPLDIDKKEQKAAAEYCDRLRKPKNIAELTKERLRRAASEIRRSGDDPKGDVGFRVFKLDTTNFREWEPPADDIAASIQASIDHLKSDRTGADILNEVLLKLGLDLCVPIEQRRFAGIDLYSIGGGVLIACLAEKIGRDETEPLAKGIVDWQQDLAPAGDTTCVFRDSAFADDVAKTNLAAILQQHGLTNVRSL